MRGGLLKSLLEQLGDELSFVAIGAGNVHILAERPATGEVVSEQLVHNKVVAKGRDVVRDLLLNVGPAPGSMAVGSGGTAVTDADTALELELFRATVTRRIASASKATFKLFIATGEGNGGGTNTYREVGLFANSGYVGGSTLAPGGTLFSRAIITPITKDNTVQVTITWEYPITSSG